MLGFSLSFFSCSSVPGCLQQVGPWLFMGDGSNDGITYILSILGSVVAASMSFLLMTMFGDFEERRLQVPRASDPEVPSFVLPSGLPQKPQQKSDSADSERRMRRDYLTVPSPIRHARHQRWNRESSVLLPFTCSELRAPISRRVYGQSVMASKA